MITPTRSAAACDDRPDRAAPIALLATAAHQPLFRSEIFAAQSSQWMGAIRLAQPVSSGIIALVSLAIASLAIAFVVCGSFTKKAHVTGITIPSHGSLSIIAPAPGIVTRSLVQEGQQVVEGQALFELSAARQGSEGEITALIGQQLAIRQHTLDTERRLRIVQDGERKRAINARLVNLASELTQLEQEVNVAERRQALARKSVGKFETLQQNGFVSQAQTQQKQEELLDLDARLSALNRDKVQLDANRISLLAEQNELASNLAKDLSQMDRSQASLHQEIAENRNRKGSLIVAPQTGTVTTITYQPGQAVVAGQALATLVASGKNNDGENGELEVHLFAASRTAGFVARGQNVLIRYQAFPYQKFGLYDGTVSDVSKTPFAPNELPANLASTILGNAQQNASGISSNEALYRIKVKLARQSVNAYGKAQPLRPGMTLEADILQDRRRIWEWVLEPILAVAHR